MKSRKWLVILGVLLGWGSVGVFIAGAQGDDEYAVYSAYIAGESSDWTQGTIFVAEETSLTIGVVRPRTTYEECMEAPEYRSDPPPRSYWCRLFTKATSTLQPRFRLPKYKLVDDAQLRSPEFGDLYFGFSPVAFGSRGDTAFFYVEHAGCPLCSSGEYVLMKKTWGRWRVVKNYGVWIS